MPTHLTYAYIHFKLILYMNAFVCRHTHIHAYIHRYINLLHTRHTIYIFLHTILLFFAGARQGRQVSEKRRVRRFTRHADRSVGSWTDKWVERDKQSDTEWENYKGARGHKDDEWPEEASVISWRWRINTYARHAGGAATGLSRRSGSTCRNVLRTGVRGHDQRTLRVDKARVK